MRSWWLASQPRSVRVYVPTAVAVAAVLVVLTSRSVPWSAHVVERAVGWSSLAVLTSLVLRRHLLRVPVARAAQNLSGVWGLSALLIWGWPEALVVSVLVAGVWEEVGRRRWERQAKHIAQVALDCGADLTSLAVAFAVLGQGHAPWGRQALAVAAYLLVDAVVVLTAVCLSMRVGPLGFLWSWTTLVMVLTEATVSLGMAAAWPTSPMAAIGLAWCVVAARAGMLHTRLHEMASTDSRTGLMTAQAWTLTATRMLTRSPVAVLMGDLDHFKDLNDTFGHLVGNDVLHEVGQIILKTLRVGDIGCRWGGEEFTIALPGMTLRQASQVAERLRGQIAERTPGIAPMTISIGVSVAPLARMEDAERLLESAVREADRAMYEAKAAGRNQVAVGREIAPSEPV